MTREAVANWGRATHVDAVQKSAKTMRRLTRNTRRAIVEADEADRTKPSDHDIIATTWKRANRLFQDQHEVAILPKGVDVIDSRTVFGCAALERQTPTRSWQVYRTNEAGGRVQTTIVGHPPAGARNGSGSHRSKEQRSALNDRYDHMLAVLVDLVAEAHDRGEDVVIKGDFNNPRGLEKVHAGQVEVLRHGPDGIYAVPANGHRVAVRSAKTYPLYIEKFHQLLVADFDFVKE